MESLIAIGLLAVLAGVGWWAYSRSQKRSGASEAEADTLRSGAEVNDAFNKANARPLVFGKKLRDRLRSRARRREL
jgi:hypothetical protein